MSIIHCFVLATMIRPTQATSFPGGLWKSDPNIACGTTYLWDVPSNSAVPFPWDLVVTLQSCENVGEMCGTFSYPGLPCHGELTMKSPPSCSASSCTYQFNEDHIVTTDDCNHEDNPWVQLDVSGNVAAWAWNYDHGSDVESCSITREVVPTPSPTWAASGDPIVNINGHRVKFELPSGQSSLMWQDDALEIFAKADVMTANKDSQWFSDFILAADGRKALHIQRKKIGMSSKARIGTLNTLSITIFDDFENANREVAVTAPGSYQIGSGNATMRIVVNRDGKMVGPLPREVVAVKSKAISFCVSSEKAKKFTANEKKALQYVHLDISVQRMDKEYVKKGIFAELWGLIPMSRQTVMLVKKIQS